MANTHPGLCRTCQHARTVENDRGSVFWMCMAHEFNPRMPKYPPLPVLECPEYARDIQERDGDTKGG